MPCITLVSFQPASAHPLPGETYSCRPYAPERHTPEALRVSYLNNTFLKPQNKLSFFPFLRNVRAISTARLNMSPCSHLRPIDVVVCDGPLARSNLGAGFALRCFQRLSCPDAATRLCHWRDNRYTGGLSSTVLSY